MASATPTFIICELAQTHEGSLALAKCLVRAAAMSQADAVKVQVFAADELCVPAYKHRELFCNLEWPEPQWRELIDFSHDCGIKIFADVFGTASLLMLVRNGIDGLKIHGTDMRNSPLLTRVGALELPLILGVGGATTDEIEAAIGTIGRRPGKAGPVLMVGFQNYPTKLEDSHLNRIKYLQQRFGLPLGYADHVAGSSPFGLALCAAAIAMGASYIEKHMTIARVLKMEDHESALAPDEFALFVSKIRAVDSAMGVESGELRPAEVTYRTETRKHVVAAVKIAANAIITDSDVALRRAPSDAPPADLRDIVGGTATKAYEVNEVIQATGVRR